MKRESDYGNNLVLNPILRAMMAPRAPFRDLWHAQTSIQACAHTHAPSLPWKGPPAPSAIRPQVTSLPPVELLTWVSQLFGTGDAVCEGPAGSLGWES